MPGQAAHCCVDVAVGAKKSVVVGEGVRVIAGVEVGTGVDEEADMAVTVRITDTSIERVGVKFESGLVTRRLHAVSRDVIIAIKDNKKKTFLIRMIASSLE